MAEPAPVLAVPPCLGVERSVLGRRWVTRAGDERLGLALAQRLSLPELVGRLLAERGLDLESAEGFLAPRLRESLVDPASFRDMETAAERVARAICDGERVAILADYDVDGASSAALLIRLFRALGAPEPMLHVPDRLVEGYGPSAGAMERFAAAGLRLVLTLDCGTTAHRALDAAADLDLEVVVLDHHQAEPRLPTAYAVVNPNRLDDRSGCGSLAAVGVVFLFAIALNRCLRRSERFRAESPEPDLLQFLDLVALGTVCDVVPLRGLNRALASQGLRVLAQRPTLGLAALAEVAGSKGPVNAGQLGFVLGPRINAGGRVGRSDLGARLLSTDDPDEARALAAELDRLNAERQRIEAEVLDAALAEAEGSAAEGPLAIAAGEGWHPGVLGIVASRIKERLGRPAIVLGFEGETARGSGRSIAGLDLGALVIAARQSGLLVSGGGHAQAAGLSLCRDRLCEFRSFAQERAAMALGTREPRPELAIDALVGPAGATLDLIEQLERLQPFGAGNPEPRFALAGVRLAHVDTVGETHLRCRLAGEDGSGKLAAIAFRALESPLGRVLLERRGQLTTLAGRLRRNTWGGRDSAQLIVEDVAGATG